MYVYIHHISDYISTLQGFCDHRHTYVIPRIIQYTYFIKSTVYLLLLKRKSNKPVYMLLTSFHKNFNVRFPTKFVSYRFSIIFDFF